VTKRASFPPCACCEPTDAVRETFGADRLWTCPSLVVMRSDPWPFVEIVVSFVYECAISKVQSYHVAMPLTSRSSWTLSSLITPQILRLASHDVCGVVTTTLATSPILHPATHDAATTIAPSRDHPRDARTSLALIRGARPVQVLHPAQGTTCSWSGDP